MLAATIIFSALAERDDIFGSSGGDFRETATATLEAIQDYTTQLHEQSEPIVHGIAVKSETLAREFISSAGNAYDNAQKELDKRYKITGN